MTTVISTVGTSLLTGHASECKAFLFQKANAQKTDLSTEELVRIDECIGNSESKLKDASDGDARDLCAEINGIVSGGWMNKDCTHYLLHTDTYQGELVASVLADYLKSRGVRCAHPVKIANLRTDCQHNFERGIDYLLRWCDQTLRPLRESREQLVFNLVGGFKALLAYAEVIGMVYADEMCYIFETSTELLRIPKLPLQFDQKPMKDNAAVMARLAAAGEQDILADELSGIPDVYIEHDGNLACLSLWGKLAWNDSKYTILKDRFLDQPGLDSESSFQKDFRGLPAEAQIRLQETLAKVAVLWKRGGLAELRRDGGLQYETYQNADGVGHFRINNGDRVSCKPADSVLLLRHCGAHDYVNRNP